MGERVRDLAKMNRPQFTSKEGSIFSFGSWGGAKMLKCRVIAEIGGGGAEVGHIPDVDRSMPGFSLGGGAQAYPAP